LTAAPWVAELLLMMLLMITMMLLLPLLHCTLS
jgi:hypothetical protein